MLQNNLIHLLLKGNFNKDLKDLLVRLRDINKTIWQGFNPLHLATLSNNIEAIEFILSLQANPNILISTPNIKSKDNIKPNDTIIINTAEYNNFLNNVKTLGNISAIHIAVKNNNINIVQLLLKYNASPNIYDEGKCSPLHWAVSQNNTDMVNILLKYKADPNVKDIINNTPLHEAVRRNNINIVKIFLTKSAVNPDIKDFFNQSAIDLAKPYQDIYNLLLKHTNYLPNGVTTH